MFSTTVHFLVSDAFDDSEVRVNFSKGPTGISCLFSNEGGGTPIEALRRSLQTSEGTTGSSKPESSQGVGQNLTPAQSDQLAEIEAWVESWGGAVSVVSLPHCMSVTIDLLRGATGLAKPDSGKSMPAQAGDAGTRSEA